MNQGKKLQPFEKEINSSITFKVLTWKLVVFVREKRRRKKIIENAVHVNQVVLSLLCPLLDKQCTWCCDNPEYLFKCKY